MENGTDLDAKKLLKERKKQEKKQAKAAREGVTFVGKAEKKFFDKLPDRSTTVAIPLLEGDPE